MDLTSFAWILCHAPGAVRLTGAGGIDGFKFALIAAGLVSISVVRSTFRHTPSGDARMGARANPLRPGMQLHRAVCLAWLIGLAAKTLAAPAAMDGVALLAVGVFSTAAVYFGACSKPTPKRREVRAGHLAREPLRRN
jgi:hypothetical protein